MSLTDPIPPKKDTTWIWVRAGVVVLGLCACVVASGLIGGYLYLQRPALSVPGFFAPSQTPSVRPEVPPVSPPRLSPTKVPPLIPSIPMSVIPYDPTTGTYPSLQSLVPNWQSSTAPGTSTWQVKVTTTDPVTIFMGWCAIDSATLVSNYQHITWTAKLDDKVVAESNLLVQDYSSAQQGSCRSFSGLIQSWTAGEHTIQIVLHFDQEINDGWSSYPAGDYIDIYQITVTP